MRIHCLTTFLDGVDRFEADDTRTVDDARGAYFIEKGWAHEPGVDAVPQAVGDVSLDVQNAVHKTVVRNG